jgi:hypothetical protein
MRFNHSCDRSMSQSLKLITWAADVTWLLVINHAVVKATTIKAAGDNGDNGDNGETTLGGSCKLFSFSRSLDILHTSDLEFMSFVSDCEYVTT